MKVGNATLENIHKEILNIICFRFPGKESWRTIEIYALLPVPAIIDYVRDRYVYFDEVGEWWHNTARLEEAEERFECQISRFLGNRLGGLLSGLAKKGFLVRTSDKGSVWSPGPMCDLYKDVAPPLPVDSVGKMSFREFAKANFTFSSRLVGLNPYMPNPPSGSTHYKCVLGCCRRKMTVYFTMGSAYNRRPRSDEVVESLVSDARTVRGQDFTEWQREFGEGASCRIWKTIQRNTQNLHRLLQNELFEQLMECEG